MVKESEFEIDRDSDYQEAMKKINDCEGNNIPTMHNSHDYSRKNLYLNMPITNLVHNNSLHLAKQSKGNKLLKSKSSKSSPLSTSPSKHEYYTKNANPQPQAVGSNSKFSSNADLNCKFTN